MSKMKKGKAPGIDELNVEMITTVGEVCVKWTAKLLNKCMKESKIPKIGKLG